MQSAGVRPAHTSGSGFGRCRPRFASQLGTIGAFFESFAGLPLGHLEGIIGKKYVLKWIRGGCMGYVRMGRMLRERRLVRCLTPGQYGQTGRGTRRVGLETPVRLAGRCTFPWICWPVCGGSSCPPGQKRKNSCEFRAFPLTKGHLCDMISNVAARAAGAGKPVGA